MSEPKAHLIKVDILRGLAIIGVFLYHSQLVLYPDYKVTAYLDNRLAITNTRQLILNFFPTSFGWTGVELFFLISGFLIHYNYLKNKRKLSIRIFYSKRFWRIYPPYLLVLIYYCFSTYGLGNVAKSFEGMRSIILHLFLIHNINGNTFFSINPSFWSLAIEAQLYLIYPLFLFAKNKFGYQAAFLISLVIALIITALQGVEIKYLKGFLNLISVFGFWFIWCAGAYLAEKYIRMNTYFVIPLFVQ